MISLRFKFDLFMELLIIRDITTAVSNGFSMMCTLVIFVERSRLLPIIKMSSQAGGMELGLRLLFVYGHNIRYL